MNAAMYVRVWKRCEIGCNIAQKRVNCEAASAVGGLMRLFYANYKMQALSNTLAKRRLLT
jgi:hypothetical protein